MNKALFADMNIKLARFTSFDFYDEADSPMIITDGVNVEVWEYLDGTDRTGKFIHQPMWAMKGDEFGSSEIGTPTHFIRQSDFLTKFTMSIINNDELADEVRKSGFIQT